MKKRKRVINFKTLFSVSIVVLLIAVVTTLIIMNSNPTYNDDYFKSDDTKIVLYLGEGQSDDENEPIKTYIVYYYSGDKITGVKQFYQFKSEEIAKNFSKGINVDEMDWVNDIRVSGPYMIFELTSDQYEGTTVTELRETIEGYNFADEDNTEDTEEIISE